jgi:hypothetical protein
MLNQLKHLCICDKQNMYHIIQIDELKSTGVIKSIVSSSVEYKYLQGSELLLAVRKPNSFWDIPEEKNDNSLRYFVGISELSVFLAPQKHSNTSPLEESGDCGATRVQG